VDLAGFEASPGRQADAPAPHAQGQGSRLPGRAGPACMSGRGAFHASGCWR